MGILRQITSTRCGIDGVTRTVNYIYGGVGGVVKRMNPNYMGYDIPISEIAFRVTVSHGMEDVKSDNSVKFSATNISRSTAQSTYGSTVSISNNNHTFQVNAATSTKGLVMDGYVYGLKSDGNWVQLTSNTTVSGVTSINISVSHYYGGSGSYHVVYYSDMLGQQVWNTTKTCTTWSTAFFSVGAGMAYGNSVYAGQTINSVTVNGYSIPYKYEIQLSGW